jgi:phosphoenolpyruvate carboxylase
VSKNFSNFLDKLLRSRYLKDIYQKYIIMATRTITNQISFRYRVTDSTTGITRETAQRLAQQLGVDETQAIHRALHDLAIKILPQYEADDGPLTAAQLRQIKKRVPQGRKRSVRSSLFDTETA